MTHIQTVSQNCCSPMIVRQPYDSRHLQLSYLLPWRLLSVRLIWDAPDSTGLNRVCIVDMHLSLRPGHLGLTQGCFALIGMTQVQGRMGPS